VRNQRVLWVILLVALVLRLPLLTGSFWLDEAAQALESIRPLAQQTDITGDFQPPLFHYLIHFAVQASRAEWWLRLWGSLIPGIITVWATYQLSKKLFNEKVAGGAALLLATSSLHIFYSQELRPYSLAVMWAMISTLLLLAKKFDWWQFAGVSLLGVYTSYLYPFFLLPQLWFVWQMKWGWQRVLKIIAALGLLLMPWGPTFWRQLEAGQALRQALPGWENAVSLPPAKSLALVPLKFLYGVLNLDPTLFFIIPAVVLLGFTFVSWRSAAHTQLLKLKKPTAKITFLLIAPLLLSWLVSFVIPVIQPKRLLYLLPFWYLLLSAPLAWPKTNRLFVRATIAIVLAINLFSLWQYWTNPSLQRENWRGLKQELVQKFPKQDTLVIFAFDEALSPWRWYQPDALPSLSIDSRQINNDQALRTQLKITENYRYLLVFDYLRTLTDPDNKLEPAVENLGFVGRGVIDYPNLGFVRIYTRPDFAIGYR